MLTAVKIISLVLCAIAFLMGFSDKNDFKTKIMYFATSFVYILVVILLCR